MTFLAKTPDPYMQLYAGKTIKSYSYDITNTIEYTFNSLGYRSNYEYNFIPEYVFFGCSTVFGIGIPINSLFSSYFANYFNLGLESDDTSKHNNNLGKSYNNYDILSTINNFNISKLYNTKTKGIVLWTDRDNENIDEIISSININFNITHFKIGKHNSKLSQNLLPQIDADVSLTHAGQKSHKLWASQIYKTLMR